jgi:hypothetical protein
MVDEDGLAALLQGANEQVHCSEQQSLGRLVGPQSKTNMAAVVPFLEKIQRKWWLWLLLGRINETVG